MSELYDVIVIGAGAAGIGAGRKLREAGARFVILEARERIGGRAQTLAVDDTPLDLGCGWLHSAEHNVLAAMAEASGFNVDRSEAPWQKQTAAHGMSGEEQAAFGRAFGAFEQRIGEEAEQDGVRAASAYLDPGGRWNALIDAVFSYISGAALDQIDARDYARYEDTGKNWRVREGYGALIAALGAGLPVELGVKVDAIDVGGAHVRVRSARGAAEARAAIIALPTSAYALLRFTPDLPEKKQAAEALPLGYAEKVHFALAEPEEFSADGHLFARTDAADTGSYHLRPLGRARIEAYFGGALAHGLAEAGVAAMADFAKQELASLLGSSFPARLTTLASTAWARDPYARGSYSYAKPGCAEARAALAAPVGNLFFAGEACSRARYSTAHGAYETGVEAAEKALAQLSPSPRA
ncbi:MAG: FAD-dependent oxidoreductase [Hyphomonadaceae bacterium]|nr:FAD-dependent oxidoreductase [Hyphomonadaceae bacterium]